MIWCSLLSHREAIFIDARIVPNFSSVLSSALTAALISNKFLGNYLMADCRAISGWVFDGGGGGGDGGSGSFLPQ